MTEFLESISTQIELLIPHFVQSRSLGSYLPTARQSQFSGLCLEALSYLDDKFGTENRYSKELERITRTGKHDFAGGPTFEAVHNALEITRAASREMSRRSHHKYINEQISKKPYVAMSRIDQLEKLHCDLDFARLIELCRELNCTAENNCHMATAMLVRAILDHVPPILGSQNFSHLANNYGGQKNNKSFKTSMQHLEVTLRSIADSYLHVQIRRQESLPTETQVNFSAELDVLLAEIIRHTLDKAGTPIEK